MSTEAKQHPVDEAMGNLVRQKFVFKGEMQGIAKKSGRAYHQVELHDPVTLENLAFFLDPDSSVSTFGINFRDPVVASFSMQFRYGDLKPVLENISKI